jgi:hypothetical protein
MPPTPWHTEIRALGAVPRIWRTLSCKAYMDTDTAALRAFGGFSMLKELRAILSEHQLI